ncbi:MAG: alpha/beta fold hydrolase [Firmicutes bacterium]|nr:alpha/beta fold hydrolase [Bacillota bacterium]
MARLELVRTTSEDGWELEGLAFHPEEGPGYDLSVVCIHGLAGRFYSRTLTELAEALSGRGFEVVSGHTRGHDYGALFTHQDGGLRLGGAAWENLAEAPYDVGGWVNWAESRWPDRRVILVGHSLGGFKVAHYLAQRHDRRVVGMVLLSPAWNGSPHWWPRELFATARTKLASEAPEQLMEVPGSPIGRLSLRTVLSRAPEAWPDPLPTLVGQAQVATLATYGSERDFGGMEELARLEAMGAATRWVGGADHHYRGAGDRVGFLIHLWMQDAGLVRT